MIYSSIHSRDDYSPCLVGNGDVSFFADMEGVLNYGKDTYPKLNNFFSGSIFRAGRRLGMIPNRDIYTNILSFGSFSFSCGASVCEYTHELVEKSGYQKSQCCYDDGSVIDSAFFLHQEKNIYALKKKYFGKPKEMAYTFSYGDESRHSALGGASVRAVKNGAVIDFLCDGQDIYKGRISIFTDKTCGVSVSRGKIRLSYSACDGESVTFYICLEDNLFSSTPKEDVNAMKREALCLGFDKLQAENALVWNDYYEKGYVKTGIEQWDSVFSTALYHMKCVTTRWSIPVGISDDCWSGRFFAFDEYYGFLALLGMGQYELAKRVPDFRRNICFPVAEHRASCFDDNFLTARFMWETTEYGHEGSPAGYHQDHVFHIPLVAMEAFEYYEYTKDLEFLAQNYRMIQASAQFFTKQMIYRDGEKVYIGKCTDLERLGASVENAFATTCSVICLLRCCAKAASLLGIDEEYAEECRKTAEELLAGLPQDEERYLPYPGAEVRSIGVFSCKYPFDVLPSEDAKMLRSFYDYIQYEYQYGNMYPGGNKVSPWYSCWKAAGFARCNMAADAGAALEQAFRSAGAFGNMYEINEPRRRYHPWFMTAAAVLLSAFHDMLISGEGEGNNIELLPACELNDVSFKLTVKGGYLVEAVIEKGNAVSVSVTRRSDDLPVPNVFLRGKPVQNVAVC